MICLCFVDCFCELPLIFSKMANFSLPVNSVFFVMLLLEFISRTSIQVSPSMGGGIPPIVVTNILSHCPWLIISQNIRVSHCCQNMNKYSFNLNFPRRSSPKVTNSTLNPFSVPHIPSRNLSSPFQCAMGTLLYILKMPNRDKLQFLPHRPWLFFPDIPGTPRIFSAK
jgi:hypothetical protein